MPPNEIQSNGTALDPNNLLPGTTFPEQTAAQQAPALLEAPPSFPGPEVNGRPTTITLFSPLQLRTSPLVPSLYTTINAAFEGGHISSGIFLVNAGNRLQSDTQLFNELGTDAGTFTYVISYTGTDQVIGTASGKRYAGRMAIVGKANDDGIRRKQTWLRFGPVPEGSAAWELSTMAVDPTLQRQGLAGYLMRLTEEEIKRRFKAFVKGFDGEEKPTRLLVMITTIKERNFEFYSRRGFVKDYETAFEKGWLGSDNGFTVINMSKAIELGDLMSKNE